MSLYKSGFIGGKFRDEIEAQINLRQTNIGNDSRTPNVISRLNSNTGWVKLTSAVNVSDDFAKRQLNSQGGTYLAQNNVLMGGSLYYNQSKNQYGLKQGFGTLPSNSYNTNPNNQLGIRPMPGINNVTVASKSRFGSLRTATVYFQCWDLQQLEIMDLLYMKPGYSLLLEWGHTVYFDNKSKYTTSTKTIDMFNGNLNKEKIYEEIYRKSTEQTNGNYDAMFGPVKNFSWTSRTDGGYDCMVEIVTIGDVVESLKINSSNSTVEKDPNLIGDESRSILSSLLYKIIKLSQSEGRHSLLSIKEIFSSDLKGENISDKTMFEDMCSSYTVPFKQIGSSQANPHVYIPLGGLLSIIKQNCLLYGDDVDNTSYVDIDFDMDENYCLSNPYQMSIDPQICLIDTNPTIQALNYSKINSIINKAGYKNEDYLGKHMRVLINVQHVLDTLKNMTENNPDRAVYLHKFLEKIVNDISLATGNINRFSVGYDVVSNSVKIYDTQRLPNTPNDNFTNINLYGKNSLVTSYNLSSKIFTSMVTMIAISAQNDTAALGIDGTAFSKISDQISDRVIPRKLDKNSIQTQQLNNASKTNLAIENSRKLISYIRSLNSYQYSINDIGNCKLALKDYLVYMISHNPSKNKATPIVPIELSITLDGISGIRIGEQFSIPTNVLPAAYKTNNGVASFSWVTSLFQTTLT